MELHKLSPEVYDLLINRLKNEYENVKHQVQHVDTFRNELLKEREEHQKTRDAHQVEIDTLNKKIDYLQLTPAKRKKVDADLAVTTVIKSPEPVITKAKIIKQDIPEMVIKKDGGSF